MMCKIIVIISLVLISLAAKSIGGIPHNHEQNRERVKDGIYTARDSNHYDEHGEHDTQFDHEAILGSVKEAKEFEGLSPDEAKQRLLLLVHKMDKNQDKRIDKQELKDWITRSFKRLAQEEADQQMEEVDENKDGMVTWREYAKDTFDVDGDNPIGNDLSSEEATLYEDDKDLFEAADLNKDGLLDATEFVMFINPEEYKEMHAAVLKQTLKAKDLDNDGKISFQEYVHERNKEFSKEDLAYAKDHFDNEYDKNSDGFLTGDEVLNWSVPDNEAIASEEADHLMMSADDNDDGYLSYNEILDNHEEFVGSEATSYGEQLEHLEHHLSDEL